jgi:hypothetical protein
MSHAPASIHCLNCGASMSGGQKYCGDCGQRQVEGRLTMGQVGHDLAHAITHADHSIFRLVKDLAWRPGSVAREFIGGRRKKHFGPFAFLFIAVALASFVILVLGVQWFKPITDVSAAGFLQRHINLVILMQAPVLSGLCALFFLAHRLTYAEHLVLAAYTSGFRCVLLALVGTPLLWLSSATMADPAIVAGYYLVWVVYFAYAAAQFYGGPAWWTACKAALAAILTQLIAIYAIFGFIWLWARFA